MIVFKDFIEFPDLSGEPIFCKNLCEGWRREMSKGKETESMQGTGRDKKRKAWDQERGEKGERTGGE